MVGVDMDWEIFIVMFYSHEDMMQWLVSTRFSFVISLGFFGLLGHS